MNGALWPRLSWLIRPGIAGPRGRTHLQCDVESAGCSVCGEAGRWREASRLSDELADTWGLRPRERAWFERREGRACGQCGASLRVRMLVWALRRERPRLEGLDVLHVNQIHGVGAVLAIAATVTETQYDPTRPLGASSTGRHNEDLTRLSFRDRSFDVVLHSETLEHVDDYSAALNEVHRVLRPGGLHLYTIPLLHRRRTRRRTERGVDAQPHHLLPPSFHGCGDEDLVYWEFGSDFLRERSPRLAGVFYDDFFRNPTVFAIAETSPP